MVLLLRWLLQKSYLVAYYICIFFIVGPSRRGEHWRDGGFLKFCVFSVRVDRGAREGCALCEETSLLRAVLL